MIMIMEICVFIMSINFPEALRLRINSGAIPHSALSSDNTCDDSLSLSRSLSLSLFNDEKDLAFIGVRLNV